MANFKDFNATLNTLTAPLSVSTFTNDWAEIPTVAPPETIKESEAGRRIILKSSDGTPLYPVSASETELKDMYADLAMTVFVQERKIKELEEKINQLISK